MSGSRSNQRQPAGQGPRLTSHPEPRARTIRDFSLVALVLVVFIIALLMVVSLVAFVIKPDPAVKAGPMYVTLILTTGSALLMLFVALNASFLPLIPGRQAPSVYLVMGAMAVTGIVTGLLTVGSAASPFVLRLVVGGIAVMFITRQNARLVRARVAGPAGQAEPASPRARPRPRSRQRRGGRKR